MSPDSPARRVPADPAAVRLDPARVEAVRATELLDTTPEDVFDRQTRLAAKIIGAPASFISLVDEHRDFYKSCVGFPEPLATTRQLEGRTFCHYTLLSEDPLVLDDVAASPGFRDVPTVHSLGVRAYLGVPLRTADGHTIGSFCAIDVQPRKWSQQDVEILTEFARSTMREIDLRAVVRDAQRRAVDAVLRHGEERQRGRLTAFAADIGIHLIQPDSLQTLLGHCVSSMVQYLDAALARIWTVSDTSRMLELQASAGLYTHLNGRHSRVSIGHLKIGRIAEERQPHLTNDILNDSSLDDRAWAVREGLVAFAGYPLIVDDRAIGVMAMFARQPVTQDALHAMGTVANAISIGIQRKRTEEALKAADRRKDVFVATMAHELRQPLAAMLPALELMRARVSEQAGHRARDVIGRQVKQLQRLVDELMNAAAIAEGKIVLRRERVDVRQIVEDAVTAARNTTDEQRQSMVLSVPSAPLWIVADAGRLQQVFSNLLTNAAKYTQTGGQIWVELETLEASIRIRVRDNGKGIAPDALPYIFDLFMQEGTDQGAGLGIGLKVVRGLVELHRGTVEARSGGPGQGSEFIVTLPLDPVDTDGVSAARTPVTNV